MNEIKDILTVLESPHLETQKTLEAFEKDSLIGRLAEGIAASRYSSDREAAQDLYGEIFEKRSFQILKSKLKQRALNTLLLSDIKSRENNPRDAMKHDLARQLVEANLLLSFGSRSTGIKILQKVMAGSEHYLLNQTYMQSMLLLRAHYWFMGNKNMYDELSLRLERTLKIIGAEKRAEELFYLSSISFSNSRSISATPAAAVHRSAKEIERFRTFAKESYIIASNDFKLHILDFQVHNRHDQVIAKCDEALTWFRKRAHLKNLPLNIYFLFAKCEAQFYLHEYPKMLRSLDELRKILPERSSNRIIIERLAFMAYMHLGNNDACQNILKKVRSDRNISIFLNANNEAEWLLYAAFAEIAATKITASPVFTVPLPKKSKDKEGMNISVLVCEASRSILSKNYSRLLLLDKRIDNYIYRYLTSRKIHRRSLLFLKMLRIVIRKEFDKLAIEKQTEKLLHSLRQSPASFDFVEIIPYERLWELFMKNL